MALPEEGGYYMKTFYLGFISGFLFYLIPIYISRLLWALVICFKMNWLKKWNWYMKEDDYKLR